MACVWLFQKFWNEKNYTWGFSCSINMGQTLKCFVRSISSSLNHLFVKSEVNKYLHSYLLNFNGFPFEVWFFYTSSSTYHIVNWYLNAGFLCECDRLVKRGQFWFLEIQILLQSILPNHFIRNKNPCVKLQNLKRIYKPNATSDTPSKKYLLST